MRVFIEHGFGASANKGEQKQWGVEGRRLEVEKRKIGKEEEQLANKSVPKDEHNFPSECCLI